MEETYIVIIMAFVTDNSNEGEKRKKKIVYG